MRIELTRVGLLVYLANHYTTRGALSFYLLIVKYNLQLPSAPDYDASDNVHRPMVLCRYWVRI